MTTNPFETIIVVYAPVHLVMGKMELSSDTIKAGTVAIPVSLNYDLLEYNDWMEEVTQALATTLGEETANSVMKHGATRLVHRQ